jgi:hypothetical protein
MKLNNQTHWRTDQLKAIIQRVAETELSPEQRKLLRVTIVYARRHGCSTGCAAYYSHWMRVRVQFENFNKIDFALVCAHEMAHTRGMKHPQMRNLPAYSRLPESANLYSWVLAMPVEKKPKRTKPPTESVIGSRAVSVAAMVAQWQSKVKRATTILKKWQRKQRYYERKVAAMSARNIDATTEN